MFRRINFLYFLFAIFYLPFAICYFSGCGYTTRSLLPPHIKKIRVENFKNSINITAEITDQTIRYQTYKPRMEQDITKAIIDKFIFDGNLKIAQPGDADVILNGELVDFRREALRYDEDNNIEQYRAVIVVKIALKDVKNNKELWHFDNFAGSYDYYTVGSQAKSEDTAVTEAINDLARRVVEQTIEAW